MMMKMVLILVFVDFLMNFEDSTLGGVFRQGLNPCFRGLSHEFQSSANAKIKQNAS